MNKLKQAILRVLRGNIFLDGKEIPVLGRYYPTDQTPCITLDDSAGASTEEQFVVQLYLPVGKEHPQYDEDNPDKLIPQECLEYWKNATIKINVWCDTERERAEITQAIRDLFYKMESDHYMFCSRFCLGECETTRDECQAINHTDKRGVKNQCPQPDQLGYANIFTQYSIIRSSFSVKEAYGLDDRTTDQPILRNVIPVDGAYKEHYTVGGSTIRTVTGNERLV